MRKTTALLATITVFASVATNSAAQASSDLRDKLTYSRAVEAILWSLPVMSFKAMRDGVRMDGGAKENEIAYNSKVQNWKLQITTPNNTTPYVMAFWDTCKEPVVLELPPTGDGVGLFGVIMDSWQRPLEDVGAKGKDQGLGGKYLLMPPDFRGDLPIGGYFPLHQRTCQGYTLMRPIIKNTSKENLDKAEAFVKKMKIYPLAQANNPPPTKHVDIFGKDVNALPEYDATYFEELHKIIHEERVLEQDKAIMGLLNAIGIRKGQPYKPDAATQAVFEKAAEDTLQYLITLFHEEKNKPFYEDRTWTPIRPSGANETGYSWEFPTYIALEERGAYYQPIFSTVRNFGAATFYLANAKDSRGQWLEGGRSYKFTVPPKAPVRDFWSVIAYDLETGAFIKNVDRDGIASSTEGLQVNQDGSVDIYFGPTAPAGKESNFVPTQDGRRYFLLFRFYGPEPAVFDKSWKLNNFEPID